ncbi:MAG: hypothetical protein NE328_06370 [Lentisphaeraceae bacterium]|nr:hypothetical protein [Lentisphaeraceae bacterium]
MHEKFKEHWRVYDPGNLLERSYDELELMEFNGFICKEIIPREDLFRAESLNSAIVIDLGFYEWESGIQGAWVLYVLGPDLNWETPIEKMSFVSLAEAVQELKKRLI